MAEIVLLDNSTPASLKVDTGNLIWQIDYGQLETAFAAIGDSKPFSALAVVGLDSVTGAVDGDWPVITEDESVLIYNTREQVGRPLPDLDCIVPELGYALGHEVLTPNYIAAWYNDRSDGEDWLISKNINGYTIWLP